MKHKIIAGILAAALVVSLGGNLYQYTAVRSLNKQLSGAQEETASCEAERAALETQVSELSEQIAELSADVASFDAQKEKYWTLAVDDYQIKLQEGEKKDTLELLLMQGEEERVLLTLDKGSDYRAPEDISAESFEECLGHKGFRLLKRQALGSSHYYEVDYYAVEEELELLASRWGSKDGEDFEIDLDGDGIRELICNVTWIADGAKDVYIYHFDGEKVLRGHGSDLLDQPADIHGVGAVSAQYLPEENEVHIDYWQDSIQGFREEDYDIELKKLKLYDDWGVQN